jgi:hypothetical protein
MNPYLPVNPCCTPTPVSTGCHQSNSVSQCNNACSTNLPVSSDVIYNGPELTCTLIAPCDTVNVALQKADAIICSLLSQITSLTNLVNVLTEQIVNINSELIIIENNLDECCNTTTTTTTASLCNQYTIIGLSGGGFFTYTNCESGFQEGAVGSGNVVTFCAISIDTDDNVYIINDGPCVL